MNQQVKGMDEKYCADCGKIISARAEICPACGVRQMAAPIPLSLDHRSPNGKSKIGAALFAFFLGAFGGHKFYLGQTGKGLLYLAFFWTAIPAVISMIEFILYLIMSDEEFDRKYGYY